MNLEKSTNKINALKIFLATAILLCFGGAIGCYDGALVLIDKKAKDPIRCEKKIAAHLDNGNIDAAIHAYENFKGYHGDVNVANILQYLLQTGDYKRAIELCNKRYWSDSEASFITLTYLIQNQQYEYAENLAQSKGKRFYYTFMELSIKDMCERGNIKEARAFKTEKIKWFTNNGNKKDRWKYEKEFNEIIKNYSK